MNLKITLLDKKIEELAQMIEVNKIFGKEPLVFEKNENSDLISVIKPCTEEFFEKLFSPSGPFWDTYFRAGFGVNPIGEKYAVFISGRMYFAKNIEKKFINRAGPEKSFYIKGDFLYEEIKLNLSNLLLILSIPLYAMKQFARVAELGFLMNETVGEYEKFWRMAIEYHKHQTVISGMMDAVKIAKESLELAVKSMAFSNLALLGYGLKIKFRKSETIENCEAEQLYEMTKRGDFDSIKKFFDFHSLYPYDISKPRFREDMSVLEKHGAPEPPRGTCLKWRENAKFLAGRFLDVERIAYMEIGKITNLGDLVFYLKTPELQSLDTSDSRKIMELADIARKREEAFKRCENVKLPSTIIIYSGKIYKPTQVFAKKIKALSVSATRTAVGPAVNVNDFEDYGKCEQGSIIVSRTLSPNLTILFRKAAGLISESGGALSHAALVAREMDIPCLVQANLGEGINDGQCIQIDGGTGTIALLDKTPEGIEKKTEESIQNWRKESPSKTRDKKYEDKKNTIKDIMWLGEDGFDVNYAGMKAANLSVMSRLYPVPSGFAITAKVFKEAVGRSKKISKLIDELNNSSSGDLATIDNLGGKVKKAIVDCVILPEIEQKLYENFQRLLPGTVAVRSSSSLEDLQEASFAGQFDTYLGVKNLEELKKAVKKCWASFYNTRAIIYRLGNNMGNADVGMAVLIQKMVEPAHSGVMFTSDPCGSGKIIIEAACGRGEKLVLGKAVPNSYLIAKDDFSITEIKSDFEFNTEKIRDIAKIGLNIEKTFNVPQDIEWCIDSGGKIWILQSRPITGLKH